jgi:hypothetical protein
MKKEEEKEEEIGKKWNKMRRKKRKSNPVKKNRLSKLHWSTYNGGRIVQ